MGKTPEMAQYVLLPLQGLRAEAATTSPESHQFLQTADEAIGTPSMGIDDRRFPLRVLDSIGRDGAKLVEASAQSALAIRALHPDLRLVPVVYYTPAVVPPEAVLEDASTGLSLAAEGDAITLRVVWKIGRAHV
jgi:hypothetical protein